MFDNHCNAMYTSSMKMQDIIHARVPGKLLCQIERLAENSNRRVSEVVRLLLAEAVKGKRRV